MNLAAFFGYAFLMAFSPGPNNIMAMTNSARVGLRRGIVFCVGVFLGFLGLGALCAVFTSALFQLAPSIGPVMKWIGALFILYLAAAIFLDRPHKASAKQHLRPDSLLTGIVMQFVNIKGVLYGVTSMSTFVLPYTRSVLLITAAVVFLALMAFVCTCCWALFGYLFQRFFETHRKLMNTVMALLLAYCAVTSVL